MRTELVVDALEMAVWRRKAGAGLIHHTDRGSQGRIQSVEATPQILEVCDGST